MGEKILSMEYTSVEDHDTHMKLAQIRDIANAIRLWCGYVDIRTSCFS